MSMAETFEIDGRCVPAEEFEAFRKTLVELPHTWFCDETDEGGDTGYDAEAPDGVVWEYRSTSTQDATASSLHRRIAAPPR